MNIRILLLFIFFAQTVCGAQAQIKQADKLFESFSYSLAIPYYLKVAEKINDPDRSHAISRLGDCYRLTNDQLHAKDWYAKAIAIPGCAKINWFYYGEALRCAQEYELAQNAFETYASLNPVDLRGKAHAKFCKEVPKLKEIPAGFEIKHITGLNSECSDFSPVFYGEGIVFVSDRRQSYVEDKKDSRTDSDFLDLFIATPQYLDEFSPGMDAPKPWNGSFNQLYHDGPVSFARHDSLVYFTRTDRGRGGKDADNFRNDRLKIFWSVNEDSWSAAKPFFMNSDEYSVGHPALSPDGNTLYFVSDIPGGLGGTDIYFCKWQNRKWSQPKNMGPLVNTISNEMFPFIIGDQLYFASDGIAGFGGLDLFKSDFINGQWSKPENLGLPINSSYDDFALVLNAQDKKGYFSSARPGGIGKDDIYSCKRIEIQPQSAASSVIKTDPKTVKISGIVKDKQTAKPLAESTVFVLNTETGKVKILKADVSGKFKAPVEKGILYVVKGMKNDYLSDCITIKSELTDTSQFVVLPRELMLDHLEMNKLLAVHAADSVVQTIYYENNEWLIGPEAEAELNKLIQVMKENPVTIELGSHTDSRGSKASNLELSQKRAESAVRYIILKGIDPTRITALGYGETKPKNKCTDGVPCSPDEYQVNRRTEFKVKGFMKKDASLEYDLNAFKNEEEISAYMLGNDFFINCLQDKRMIKTETDPITKATQVPGKTANEKPGVSSGEIAKTGTTKVVSTVNPNDTEYRVQLVALGKEKSLNDPDFDGIDDLKMYFENGAYKYTSGTFSTYAEARTHCKKMVQLGYKGAFVVTFTNGKRK